MIKSKFRFSLLTAAVLMLVVGTARAQQVTIGPITASGMPGQQVDFPITFTGGPTDTTGASTTNGVSFNVLYPASSAAIFTPVFRGTSHTAIQCSTASDLDPAIATSGVLLSSGKIAFTVIGLDLSTGPIPFGRTGVLGSCKFQIVAGAAGGTVPLPCDPAAGATTASDVDGNNLTASCVDGTLTVGGDTPTNTPVSTNTDTPVAAATNTNTPVATNTNTPGATETNTPVATNTNTPGATNTNTPVATNSNTPGATNTNTAVATDTSTPGATSTSTSVATNTNTPGATSTNTAVATDTSTPGAAKTNTPVATSTSTSVATNTNTPAATNTSTPAATSTNTPARIPSNTPTATPVGPPQPTPHEIRFSLFPNPQFIPCLQGSDKEPPTVEAKLKTGKLNDELELKLKNFKPGLDFDLFTVQRSPQRADGTSDPNFTNFGLAWYQSEIQVKGHDDNKNKHDDKAKHDDKHGGKDDDKHGNNASPADPNDDFFQDDQTLFQDDGDAFEDDDGDKHDDHGHGEEAKAKIRTILLNEIFGFDPDVNLPPTHTFHVGFWFDDPADAAACGFTGSTPFNGEHNAGPLAFITRPTAATGLGPLCTNADTSTTPATCNP